ncbi:MAG TPA: O-antigen ligase family protein [Candidatus Paceibacterota bacterium]|nr:O-antigen ligase family protein [Candidatus Paceibacterota bacterium]
MSRWKLQTDDVKIAGALHLAIFALVVSGLLPRAVVPFWAAAWVLWAAMVPVRTSVLLFAFAVPAFVAIPITTDFDNFNMWRLAALVIFLKWFFTTQSWLGALSGIFSWLRAPHRYPAASLCAVLFIMAAASVTQATDVVAALRRIIYFANALLVPFVAFMLVRGEPQWRRQLIRAIGWSGALVIAAGFVQLAATYLMDVYAFMRIWGEGIQMRQFGELWSLIAVRVGNTWLAYYGPQLSLRMFSLFPDSHSFPIYVIFALGGIIPFALAPIWERTRAGITSLRPLLRTRGTLAVLWIVLGFLAAILSGTRGIWAASVGLVPLSLVLFWWMRRTGTDGARRSFWKYLTAWLAAFYLLFAIAWPIFVSPQFLLSGGDRNLLSDRLRSIVDFGETSNSARLEIWGASLRSIGNNPLLGVGIGNFPTVLGQNVILAKAGSTAHNIWLHVAAETGLISLIAFVLLWAVLFRDAWRLYTASPDPNVAPFAGWMLFAVPWVAAYLLTDATLLDERVLLQFGILFALMRGSVHQYS